MVRHIAILIVGLVPVASLSAGSIQLGQIVSGVNDGLTTTYMTMSASTSGNCSDTGQTSPNCITGSTSGSLTRSFDGQEFANATPAATVFAGQNGNNGASPGTLTDSADGVTFAMISQSSTNSNLWAVNSTSAVITLPVGIFGVQNVWTMLNDYFGKSGVSDTVVKFTFSSVSATDTNASQDTTVTFDLVNGTQIRSAVDCSTTMSGETSTQISNCNSLDFATTLAPSSSLNGSVNVNNTGATNQAYTILTNNLFSSVYTNATLAPYANTEGNVVLDDQGFEFGTQFSNDYLVSITVSDPNYLVCSSAPCLTASRSALTAVSVQTAAQLGSTPEPSTVFLLLGGLGTLGFARFRRNK